MDRIKDMSWFGGCPIATAGSTKTINGMVFTFHVTTLAGGKQVGYIKCACGVRFPMKKGAVIPMDGSSGQIYSNVKRGIDGHNHEKKSTKKNGAAKAKMFQKGSGPNKLPLAGAQTPTERPPHRGGGGFKDL